MKKPVTITGLDIGSSKISAVVSHAQDGHIVNILAETSMPSRGISKGSVVDLNEAALSLSKIVSKLKDKISARSLDNIYVNISGADIKAERSKGMIPLSMRGREVTRPDIDRCINVASTIQLPFDRDIIHKIVLGFSVDDQPAIKNPLGLYASRLACEMYVITADINHIENIYKCVNSAGLDAREAVFTGIADGMGILSEEERMEGSAILKIGATLSEVSIYSGGVLSDIVVIPAGAKDFKPSLEGSAELGNILSVFKNRIEGFTKRGNAVKSVVFTGGLAFSDGIMELLEAALPYPVKLGIAKDVTGELSGIDSIKLATAIGLARYGADKYRSKIIASKNILQHISNKVVDIFNNYF